MDRAEYFDPEGRGAALAARLAVSQPFEPLAPHDAEIFTDFQVASLVEIRLGTVLAPELARKERSQWLTLGLDEGERILGPFAHRQHPYWVTDGDTRVGTIAFSVTPGAWAPTIEVSNVYVLPSHRRQGWGGRMLGALRDLAFAQGFERVMLRPEWVNQPGLQFYCSQRMWVQNWKHSFVLYFGKSTPAWDLTVVGQQARFTIAGQVRAIAEQRGHTLDWTLMDGVERALAYDIEATCALQLAVMGWPLIRSEDKWQRQIRAGFSDGGDFEGLAFKIRNFERHIRRKRWRLPARRNPSFVTLPTIIGLQHTGDQTECALSDGTKLVIPHEYLEPSPPSDHDPLQETRMFHDEVVWVLRSGADSCMSLEHMLWLNKSPEHLEQTLASNREYRRQAAEHAAKRAIVSRAAAVAEHEA
ncbi:MAG: GNAT family N-acetyltransferase [Polyangiales bacterium]